MEAVRFAHDLDSRLPARLVGSPRRVMPREPADVERIEATSIRIISVYQIVYPLFDYFVKEEPSISENALTALFSKPLLMFTSWCYIGRLTKTKYWYKDKW